MALLRQVPNRNRKLTIPITEGLEQRLDEVKRRCQERHMDLPFQEAFEAFLGELIDEAEAELSGAAPSRRARGNGRGKARDQAVVRSTPPTVATNGNGPSTTN